MTTTSVASGTPYLNAFSGWIGQYLNYQTEKVKAEASGQAQLEHAATVETQSQVQNATSNSFEVDNKTMMIAGGALALVAIVLIAKR